MKNLLEMRLADEQFYKMLREEKTVEIRLYDEKRRGIKTGDRILFRCMSDETNFLIVKATALHRFGTFKELFSSALSDKTGFGGLPADKAAEYMYNFYTKEQEKKYGVLAIGISMEESLTLVFGMLIEVYKDCNISDEDIYGFAEFFDEYFFKDGGNLNDILNIVFRFEENMRAKGARIEVGKQCTVYDRVINRLEMNEENAMRLYESFSGYQTGLAFSYLMNEFEEWLTPAQKSEILSIARETFDECVWGDYV